LNIDNTKNIEVVIKRIDVKVIIEIMLTRVKFLLEKKYRKAIQKLINLF